MHYLQHVAHCLAVKAKPLTYSQFIALTHRLETYL